MRHTCFGMMILGMVGACNQGPVATSEKVTYIAPVNPIEKVQPKGILPIAEWKEQSFPAIHAKVKFPQTPKVEQNPNFKTQWGLIRDTRIRSQLEGVDVELRCGEFDSPETKTVDLKQVIQQIIEVEESFKGTEVIAKGELHSKYGQIPTATYRRSGKAMSHYWLPIGRRLYTLRFAFDESLQLHRVAQQWYESFSTIP